MERDERQKNQTQGKPKRVRTRKCQTCTKVYLSVVSMCLDAFQVTKRKVEQPCEKTGAPGS